MEKKRIITTLIIFIILLSSVTTLFGIFSSGGPGRYEYQSIRGRTVTIYGEGIYQHMSAEVAVQGIAQDYITLLAGIPLLIISLSLALRNSLKGKYMLAGTLGYFLVTYLFYTAMAMYNFLFLFYAALLGCSFFAFVLTLFSFDISNLKSKFSEKTPVKFPGGFLVFTSVSIALLWLGVVLGPLTEDSIYPQALEHYTTLIVQGFDLGLLLPLGFVSGILLFQKKQTGFLAGPVYLIFLSILMTSLTAKIIAMSAGGINVFPVIIIIPSIAVVSIICSILLLKNTVVADE